MAQSTLSKIINNGENGKVRIGFTDGMSVYTNVLKETGDVYARQGVMEYHGKKVDSNGNFMTNEEQESMSSGLGSFQMADEQPDQEGLFPSNQMAAIAVYPFLAFPYKDMQTGEVRGIWFYDLQQTSGG